VVYEPDGLPDEDTDGLEHPLKLHRAQPAGVPPTRVRKFPTDAESRRR
jgi:hypothetical protein